MLANRRKCIRNAQTKRVFKQTHHHTVCVEAAWIREHIVACGLDQVPKRIIPAFSRRREGNGLVLFRLWVKWS
jgi:hypothetical protein